MNTFEGGEIRVGPHRLVPSAHHAPNREPVRQIRRTFGMIFQDFQLFPHLTALENVMEAPVQVLKLPRADAASRAQNLLQRVGLGQHVSENVSDQLLRRPETSRVAIARAPSPCSSRGLLCDAEITQPPWTPESEKQEVLAVLENLKREGLTLIMVTHEIGFARRAADRILVLADGKIIEDGPPAQVIDNPRTERTRTFLRCVLG